MKKITHNQMESISGGQWYSIIECVMDMESLGVSDVYTAVELCALADMYPVD